MKLDEAYWVLACEGFMSYMGPGYRMVDAIHDFMKQYPRGKGIKDHEVAKQRLYQACLAHKTKTSRTRTFR